MPVSHLKSSTIGEHARQAFFAALIAMEHVGLSATQSSLTSNSVTPERPKTNALVDLKTVSCVVVWDALPKLIPSSIAFCTQRRFSLTELLDGRTFNKMQLFWAL
jgi:hypothetical protein